MVNTPKKIHTVGISWEIFQDIKNEALEKETSIRKVIEDKIKSADKTEAPSTQEVFTCPECGKEFETKKQLQGHMLGAHNQGTSKDDEIPWYDQEVDRADA